MSKQALLIFAKNPEAGKVKTRLAATLGQETALAVYRQLLLHTASITGSLPVDKIVFYSSFIEDNDLWSDNNYQKLVQRGDDLGERMRNAFDIAFKKNYHKVVIIGTDCPDLNEQIISNSFFHLDANDVVIGPAADGGYYLLGMKQSYSTLFENMHWSTDTVLIDTIQRCRQQKLSYHSLPVLNDIDEAKDLDEFHLYKRWEKN